MSQHKLVEGNSIIDGLNDLGLIMGYHVKKEFPIDEAEFGESSAVDVAWFSKPDNKFPLFIFEVESKATNGMTNNPLKVYAQETSQFEKPLFFFHIVTKGGAKSSRPKNLESQYGKHNYRIYLIGCDAGTNLFCDILSQHNRISEEINYIDLYKTVKSENWIDKVSVLNVLQTAIGFGLSRHDVITDLVKLSISDKEILPLLLNTIRAGDTPLETCTYIGANWGEPLLYSLVSGETTDINEADAFAHKILEWQNHFPNQPMISSMFGLSRDYDEFIIGFAPQYILVIFVVGGFNHRLCKELLYDFLCHLKSLDKSWIFICFSSYILHLTAKMNMREEFSCAREYLLKFPQLNIKSIYTPPPCISIMDTQCEDYYEFSNEQLYIPEIDEFSKNCIEIHSKVKIDNSQIALYLLSDESYLFSCNEDLLSALWA